MFFLQNIQISGIDDSPAGMTRLGQSGMNGDVLQMNFQDFYWADSDIESINIEYDRATLVIWNDALQRRLAVVCSGFAGMTNLCIWDDTIIAGTSMQPAGDADNEFLRDLYKAYSKNKDYGGRSLGDGLLEMRIELVNGISFRVYCQKIEVFERDVSDPYAQG